MTAEELCLKYREELIKTLSDLVKIPSVVTSFDPTSNHPFGDDVNRCLEYMLNRAKLDGFTTVNCDGYAGHIDYGNPDGKLIGILGHLDVVPVSEHWTHEPFGAEVIDGKMYGRGTEDDKGPTVAAYYALKIIKDLGIKFKNNVRLILGTDEETGWRGVNYYFSKYPRPVMGFSPDASFPLIYGEKGGMHYDLSCENLSSDDVVCEIYGGERYNVVLDEVRAIVKNVNNIGDKFLAFAKDNNLKAEVEDNGDKLLLTLHGSPSHGAWPQGGVNAGTYLCVFLKDYTDNGLIHLVADKFHLGYYLDKFGLDYDDYEMGKITCNIGIMNISSTKRSRVTLDLRVPVRYDIDKFYRVFNETIGKYSVVVDDHSSRKVHYVSPDDKLVTDLYDSYVKYTGDTEHKPFTIGGGTYAGLMDKGVAFGVCFPGDEELAHQDDEFIKLESLYKSLLIFVDAIIKLGEVDA